MGPTSQRKSTNEANAIMSTRENYNTISSVEALKEAYIEYRKQFAALTAFKNTINVFIHFLVRVQKYSLKEVSELLSLDTAAISRIVTKLDKKLSKLQGGAK